jgi:hypothetical protein
MSMSLVEEGVVGICSDAVRIDVEQLIDVERRRRIGQEVSDVYRRSPQTDVEVAGLEATTRALIEGELW